MAMPDQGRRRVVGVALEVVVLVAVGLAVPVARGLLEDKPVAPAAPVTTAGGGPWERLPRPPASDVLQEPDPAAAVWTGEELLLVGPSAFGPPDALRPLEALAYDPNRDRWRRFAAPPPAFVADDGLTGLVWTGDRLLVWGGLRNLRGNLPAITEQGAAYRPR
jgi:hypothetical protein